MRYALLLSCLAACCVSCNDNSTAATTGNATRDTAATTTTTQTDTAIPANTTACYVYQTSNNLVALKLNGTSPTVSGNLEYDFLGKDKNTGRITGAMYGDTLLANYSFMVEGVPSVRQVAFLKKGNTYTEGNGDMIKQNGTMVFKNKNDLTFGNIVLNEVPCTTP